MDLRDPVIVKLPYTDFGQILDGLRIVEEQWSSTLRYHETGDIDPDVPTMECTDVDEAQNMTRTYRRLIAAIGSQLSSVANS